MYNNEQAILNFGYVGQTSERLGRFDDASRIMSAMQKEEDEKHKTDPERRYKVLLYLQHIPLPNGMSMYDWLVAMSGGTDLTVPSQPLIDFVKYCLEDPLTVVSIKPGVSCLSLPNVLLRYFGVHPKFAPFYQVGMGITPTVEKALAPSWAILDYADATSPDIRVEAKYLRTPFHLMIDEVIKSKTVDQLPNFARTYHNDFFHQVNYRKLAVRACPPARTPRPVTLGPDRRPAPRAADGLQGYGRLLCDGPRAGRPRPPRARHPARRDLRARALGPRAARATRCSPAARPCAGLRDVPVQLGLRAGAEDLARRRPLPAAPVLPARAGARLGAGRGQRRGRRRRLRQRRRWRARRLRGRLGRPGRAGLIARELNSGSGVAAALVCDPAVGVRSCATRPWHSGSPPSMTRCLCGWVGTRVSEGSINVIQSHH